MPRASAIQSRERKEVSRVNRGIEMRIGTNISLAVSNRTVADSYQDNFRRNGFPKACALPYCDIAMSEP